MSSLYVQGRNKNHHHSDDDGDEMANGNRTHKIHVCMLLSDTTLPLPPLHIVCFRDFLCQIFSFGGSSLNQCILDTIQDFLIAKRI